MASFRLARALSFLTQILFAIWKTIKRLLLPRAAQVTKTCRNFTIRVLWLIGISLVALLRVGKLLGYNLTGQVLRVIGAFFICTKWLALRFARVLHRHPEAFICAHALCYAILALAPESFPIDSEIISAPALTSHAETALDSDIREKKPAIHLLEGRLIGPSYSQPHRFAHLLLFLIHFVHYWTHVFKKKSFDQQTGKHLKHRRGRDAPPRSHQA